MKVDRNKRQDQGARLKGLEIFEIKPVMMGGDPEDPENNVYLSREQHVEAVRYWNGIVRALKRRTAGG